MVISVCFHLAYPVHEFVGPARAGSPPSSAGYGTFFGMGGKASPPPDPAPASPPAARQVQIV